MSTDRWLDWFKTYTEGMRKRILSPWAERGDYIPRPEEVQGILDEFDMKVAHTYAVQARCEEIANWLVLSDPDRTIASLCGLFHDLGRFEQAVYFGTMDDRVTGSHADKSEAIFLREAPRAGLPEQTFALIADAIRCHNLYRLPDLDEKTRLFARLVRDADKLDIFRHTIALRTAREKRVFRFLPDNVDGEVNAVLAEAVARGENINAVLVGNLKDRILLEVSFVYDLNFGISFQQTLAMDYVRQITSGGLLPAELTAKVTAFAESYMQARTDRR